MSEAGGEHRRVLGRSRSAIHRARRRRGVMLVSVEVESEAIAGLERLGLLAVGERDHDQIASAIARFLAAARPVAAIGDALWPEPDERHASPDRIGDLDAEA